MVMEGPSYNTSLVLLNLFIGMCNGERGLPNLFRRFGYENRGIEVKFVNSEGDFVQPELIIASEQKSHALLFEWKDGANLEEDQLRRYSKVTARDLRQRAQLMGSSADSFDITIVAHDEHVDRIVIGLRRGGYRFPLLAITNSKLQLRENIFCCQELNLVFKAGLDIDWDIVSTYYVPFDMNSKPGDIAEKIMRNVVVRMRKREGRINVNDIAADIVPAWGMIDGSHKKKLRKKLTDIMREASTCEFKEYLKYNRELSSRNSTMATWDIMNNPIALHAGKNSKGVKRIGTLVERFLKRLETGKEFKDEDRMLPFDDDDDDDDE